MRRFERILLTLVLTANGLAAGQTLRPSATTQNCGAQSSVDPPEQRLGAVVAMPDVAPYVLVPDQARRVLRVLRWNRNGSWGQVGAPVPLAGFVQRVVPHRKGVCVTLEDGTSLSLSKG